MASTSPEYINEQRELKIEKVEDWLRLPSNPLVSVWMITYNHEPFISQALDSILLQEVDFDYEVVIGEDKSTDRTREIVEEYQRRHPDKIRLRLARENLYSQKLKPGIGVLAACRGRYIAFLEGDDYWTDPKKLQKQVEVFEKYPECVICGGRAKTWHEAKKLFTSINPRDGLDISCLSPRAYFDMKDWVKTCTRLERREILLQVPHAYQSDSLRTHYILAKYPRGTVRCLSEVVAIYREHAGGVHSGASQYALDRVAYRHTKLVMDVYHDGRRKRFRLARKATAKRLAKSSSSLILRARFTFSYLYMDLLDLCSGRPSDAKIFMKNAIYISRYAYFPGRNFLKQIFR